MAQPSIPIEQAIVFQVPQPSVIGDELVDSMQPDIVAMFQGILPVQRSSNFQKPHDAPKKLSAGQKMLRMLALNPTETMVVRWRPVRHIERYESKVIQSATINSMRAIRTWRKSPGQLEKCRYMPLSKLHVGYISQKNHCQETGFQ